MKKFLTGLFLALCSLMLSAGENGIAVSILGDSYSTFRGAIPQGNAVWYPNRNNDVISVESCWWHLVIGAIGGRLEKNESWSGSTICYTGYSGRNAASYSVVRRVDRLGNPDLILICGATNDSWAGSPIGDYQWENWQESDLFHFRPAMAKMLYDIKRLYPQARVFFILNDCLKPVINESVHEICRHYGIVCIDLKNIDKQSGHPSVKGMRAIADQVIEAISR